jgi:MATE family multidrug resistance protein
LLAANHVLFQLFLFGVLVLDGFEASAQALTGTALGARSRSALIATLRLNLGWGAACALLVATVLVAALPLVAPHMAKAPEVAALVVRYGAWLAPALLLGIWAFVLDGVYVGATWTRPLLATMALAVLAFGLALWGLPRVLGNDGLWAALCVLMVARAAAQTARLGGLVRTALPDATP